MRTRGSCAWNPGLNVLLSGSGAATLPSFDDYEPHTAATVNAGDVGTYRPAGYIQDAPFEAKVRDGCAVCIPHLYLPGIIPRDVLSRWIRVARCANRMRFLNLQCSIPYLDCLLYTSPSPRD